VCKPGTAVIAFADDVLSARCLQHRRREPTLRANVNETSTPRKFTLEGVR